MRGVEEGTRSWKAKDNLARHSWYGGNSLPRRLKTVLFLIRRAMPPEPGLPAPVVMLTTPHRRAHRAAICALVALVASGCSSGASGDEVGIAVALDPQRAGMSSIYNGVQLAVEELNARPHGQLGHRRFVMVRGSATVRDPVKIAAALS